MINRVSTNYLYNSSIGNMNQINNRLSYIVKKTGSNNLYDSFAELSTNNNIKTAINLDSYQKSYSSYIKNAEITKTKLNKILISLEQIYNIALELQTDIINNYSNIFNNFDQFRDFAQIKLNELKNLLNSNILGCYIFSGSHLLSPAVNDLDNPNFSIDSKGNRDYYYGKITKEYYQGDNTINSIALDSNFKLSYGVTADNDAFAQLIAGIHLALNSSNTPELLERSQNLINTSMSDLLDLQQKTRHNYNTIEQYQEFYESTKLSLLEVQEKINKENNLDIMSLTADYMHNESILSAAQYMFSHLKQSSIMTYL